MLCPKCQKELLAEDAGNFCPECGAELTGPSSTKTSSPIENFDFSAIFEEIKAASAPAPVISFKPEPVENSCCVKVEYNTNLFFLCGSQAVMKLLITPLSGKLRKLQVFMETLTAEGRFRQKLPVRDLLIPGRSIELSCEFTPQEVSGTLRFSFYIGCQSFHETKYYYFNVEHKVYDPRQSGSSIGSIIINQNMAEKAYVGENNLGAIREIAKKAPPSAYEMIDQLNSLPPCYQLQQLRETIWKPSIEGYEGTIYKLDEKEHLALSWNGCTIFLIGKKKVCFGRSPEKADILVRVGGRFSDPRSYPNNTVSRLHAELLYCEDTVQFFDRSSYGTYINGKRPDNAGILIPDEADIEFGDIHWHMQIQHCTGRRNAVCDYCNAYGVKSLTFTCKDDEKEYYLLVWQCCELGLVIPELTGWILLHLDNAFLIQTPDGRVVALQPGQTVSSGSQKILIKYFLQN